MNLNLIKRSSRKSFLFISLFVLLSIFITYSYLKDDLKIKSTKFLDLKFDGENDLNLKSNYSQKFYINIDIK